MPNESIWDDIRGWGTGDWERFLRRVALHPRTYCMAYVLGLVLATLAGVTLSQENTRGALCLFAVAALSA